MAGKQSVNKGWFSTPDGRATARSTNNSTAWIGCSWRRGQDHRSTWRAEGLISIELAKAGDRSARRRIVPEHVKVGNKLRGDLPVTFEVRRRQRVAARRNYDIVIALALLQKVRNPTAVAARLAAGNGHGGAAPAAGARADDHRFPLGQRAAPHRRRREEQWLLSGARRQRGRVR